MNKSNAKRDYGFFAWMDAYIATEANTENYIAITSFFDKKPFGVDDVTDITFLDIGNEVVINSFTVANLEDFNKDYSAYAITFNYTAKATGVFETSGVKITLNTNKIIEYPVGKWTFDVGESSEEIVDTWESPAVSSNGVINNGTIDIHEGFSSPFLYIKSKIDILLNNENKINYGKGCYCGAMNSTEDMIEVSKKQNSIQ